VAQALLTVHKKEKRGRPHEMYNLQTWNQRMDVHQNKSRRV
jgi:hypothetical protein